MSTDLSLSHFSLQQMGWRPFFQQQLTLDEWEATHPAKVMAVHRSILEVSTEAGELSIPVHHSMPSITVGDWLLLNEDNSFHRLLERSSLFVRKAAGSKVNEQLIAANLDSVFIVSSMNDDFNLSRIERYLAATKEAGAEPVIILTKADCCSEPESYTEQVQALDSLLSVVAVNSLDPACKEQLSDWCRTGQTVALVGSSGVGKSTITNTLLGRSIQETGGIREDDSKGRHTTTGRSLHMMSDGGLLLDTPGMRELQLAGCEQGVEETFADIIELAENCRFSDCQHESEPDCAVNRAIEEERLEQRRFKNYQKLLREQARNGSQLAERRAKDKDFTRYIKDVAGTSRAIKKGMI
ncbi:ribosome small subunit-dependent GTPase A [Endozoicomonas sp. OPT23]|uniref:ribosome small subunit-dependent GTPase A n=1 Tax=Endozoicomonas sp. OPT23 TaxID=2072845 RepID=UPI00129AAE8F|nr:ribosome small subunit-dependent GTPase A [Endozoicomonas sp. OPT23]MRI35130.1 ribosome small subunit-dependent GTPase A [Endozoicomonas sp. OPT23]